MYPRYSICFQIGFHILHLYFPLIKTKKNMRLLLSMNYRVSSMCSVFNSSIAEWGGVLDRRYVKYSQYLSTLTVGARWFISP